MFRTALSRQWYYVVMPRVQGTTYSVVLPRPTKAASPITYYVSVLTPLGPIRTREIDVAVVEEASDCLGSLATVASPPAGGVILFQASGQEGFDVKHVQQDLSSKDAEYRLFAAAAAAFLGDRFVPALAALATRDADPRVREAALGSLRAIGEPAVGKLAATVGEAKKSAGRIDAARALGLLRVDEPAVRSTLLTAAASKDPDLAWASRQALDEIARADRR